MGVGEATRRATFLWLGGPGGALWGHQRAEDAENPPPTTPSLYEGVRGHRACPASFLEECWKSHEVVKEDGDAQAGYRETAEKGVCCQKGGWRSRVRGSKAPVTRGVYQGTSHPEGSIASLFRA